MRPWRTSGRCSPARTSAVNIVADAHAVYVGTSLGPIALDARTGRRLWYALPMMDS